MTKKSQNKLLLKAYKQSFTNINKKFFDNKNTGLLLFAEYLRYLRDSYILKYFDTADVTPELTTLIAAVAEFDAYKDSTETQNKTFHWNNFCELIKQNMEGWLHIDDSI